MILGSRLSNATLAQLPQTVARPDYDRATLRTGIVHLGLGAFHRAHQAVMTDAVLAQDPTWGILGVSLRSTTTRDALLDQDNLYSVHAVDREAAARRVIGALTGVLVAPENRFAVVHALADPQTRIVSTTVTEKGYSHDPATGNLREEDLDILHDLTNPQTPRTTLGLIVYALKLRKETGLKPFTVLPCDNIRANGKTLRRLVLRFAELVEPDLARWIEDKVAFPSTMVDRIVPATTDADRASVAAALGVVDQWPVMTEPFLQWVVEDRFAAGRPLWEKAGAQFVSNVAPYELMKLRLLNGAHSTIAYLGFLMGHDTVAQAMSEPALLRLIEAMMADEVSPTLPALAGFDLAAYRYSLVQRFRNPALQHRNWQIAMDGSQKLPQRLLGTVRDRLWAGAPFERLALGVAAWMRYVTGIDEKRRPIEVRDPLVLRLRALADASGPDAEKLVSAMLVGVSEIFGQDLAQSGAFRLAVTKHLHSLFTIGAAQTVRDYKN